MITEPLILPGGIISGSDAIFQQTAGSLFLSLLKMDNADTDSGPGGRFLYFLAREFALSVVRTEELPDLARLTAAVPPEMTGSVYVDDVSLTDWFKSFLGALDSHCGDPGERAACIRNLRSDWKDLGKVTLHLAENKKDTDGTKPFAFLAACQHKLSESGQVSHIPLGSAVKLYAADRAALLAFLTPLREAAEAAPFLGSLMEDNRLFKPCLFSAADAWHFLHETETIRSHGIPVRIAGLWKKHPPRLKMDVVLDVRKQRGLLAADSLVHFSVGASLGGVQLTEEELREIMSTGGGLIRIKGEWVDAETERVRRLLECWHRASGMSLNLVQALRLLSGAAAPGEGDVPRLEEDICQVNPSPDFADALQALRDPDRTELPELPENLDRCLRPYQRTGVKFLRNMLQAGLGVCLADDMGLGKTLQMITCMELFRREGTFRTLPALIIVPASLLTNWMEEFARFAPDFKVKNLHPSALTREESRELESDPETFLTRYDGVLVTYAMVSRRPFLKDHTFPLIVLDEAQQIKNPASGVSRSVRSLRGSGRVAMTGTPVENSLSDLWSIFDFICPSLLGKPEPFRAFVRRMEAAKDYSPLRKLVKPFILHRLKTDRSILSDLPEKIERNERTSLTLMQAKFYRRIANAMKRDLAIADDKSRSGVVLGYLLQFKQVCDHPSLFSGNGEFAPERSGKLQRLGQLADFVAQRGEKMLVFTQFREMTEVLHEYLANRFKRRGLILHGGTPVEKRQEFVRQFQQPEGPPFFIISLKAGGTGLNLTAAAHVVHFDRWWNPAVENQATDRAYRIGQKQTVMVHKFVTPGTIEERIDKLIAGKRSLADSLLEEGAVKLLTEMNNAELMEFVRLDPGLYDDDEENDA